MNHKKYSNIAVSAMASSARPIRITQAPWRRSDRAFRSRDLDFHRTVTGGLRRRSRVAREGLVVGCGVDRPTVWAMYRLYTPVPWSWGRGAGHRRL